MATLLYQLNNATLKATLQVAQEIDNEMGMQPERITVYGTEVKYTDDDALRVMSGDMSEEIYLERNIIP